MLACRGCGVENPANHRFCGACGTSLTAACPTCGAPAVPGFAFCGQCGNAVTSGSVADPLVVTPAAGVTERRVCSVLFADLVGFTSWSESRDHEEVRELLSRYFDLTRTVVARYGGVVEKFIGDATMAVWGTPLAEEGDVERAVRSGLDLVASVAALGEQIGADGLALRVGVVTGEVTTTVGAVGEGMVAGDAVNTAARVQGLAVPGTVWVDETTHRLVPAAIGFTDAGQHLVKGKSEPLHLWQVTRVMSNLGGQHRMDGLEAPMLGRAAEERALQDQFHTCAERRVPRLVAVTGHAGMGKSRLGWELEKYVDGLADPVWWHRGRCLSYGDGASYWALAEAIRQRFDIAEEDSAEIAARKFAGRLAELVPDEQQQRFLGVRLGRLLGLPHPDDTDASLTREDLFEGWRQFLEHLARSEPVLLLIEDAQHADDALLDFLVHATEWTRDAPLLIVVFGRTELLERRPDLGSGRNRSSLNLDALGQDSMRELVSALVCDVPEDAVTQIVEQAQGNPLFAVETVRSLIDREVVVPVDGEFRMVGNLGTLSVPDSLHGLLAARLDGLDPQLRGLVADAAVIGTSFPADALTAVSGRPAAEVLPDLAELVRRDILHVATDPLSPQRGAYVFGQNLLRQVAYETLSRRDRRSRHLAVARHLQQAFTDGGEEVMDVIARHYLDALEAASGDEDEEIRRQAFTSLVRAGERARHSGAQLRAAQTFTQAADLISDAEPLECARVLEKAQSAYANSAQYEEMYATSERARALYLAHGDRRGAARTMAGNGRWLSRSSHLDEALPILQEAVEELRRDPDEGTVSALSALITVYISCGRVEAARAVLDEALGLAQDLGVDDRTMADVFGVAGVTNLYAQRSAEAWVQLQHARTLSRRAADIDQEIRSTTNLAEAVMLTDPVASADLARSAAALARQCGDKVSLEVALGTMAEAQLVSGHWAQIAADIADSERDGSESGDLQDLMAALLLALRGDAASAAERATLPRLRASKDKQDRDYLGWLDIELAASAGDVEAALGLARVHVRSLSDELHYLPAVCTWSLAMRSALDAGQIAEAGSFVETLELRPRGQVPAILHANLTLARARILAAEDDDDAVGARFDDALEQLRSSGAPYFLAQGLLDAAGYGVHHGKDVSALLDEARAIADQLGATNLLRRLSVGERVGAALDG